MTYKFIEPRRPQEYNLKQINAQLKKGPVVLMPKADGVRIHLIVSEEGQVFLRSREDKPFRALTDFEKRLNEPHLANLRVDLAGWTAEFEAEVIDHGTGQTLPCEKTSGALNRNEQLGLGRMVLNLFDLHHEDTRKQSLEDRLSSHDALNAIRTLVHAVATFKLLPFVIRGVIRSDIREIEEHYQEARALGYEGIVVTPQGAPYAHGKKVASGWKMKPVETFDGTVTGFIEAVAEDGTPKGMVGSLEVSYEDGTKGIAGAGALTHEERIGIWRDQGPYIGRLVEVKAMETFEGTGGKRHPNFLRWRDDIENKGVKQ